MLYFPGYFAKVYTEFQELELEYKSTKEKFRENYILPISDRHYRECVISF